MSGDEELDDSLDDDDYYDEAEEEDYQSTASADVEEALGLGGRSARQLLEERLEDSRLRKELDDYF